MTPDQADTAADRIAALWPHPPMSADTALAWSDQLQRLDHAIANWAIDQLARTSSARPAVAQILATATAETRRRQTPAAEQPAALPDPATVQRMAALWRGALADAAQRAKTAEQHHAELGMPRGAAGHWHGGPHPCNLCAQRPEPACT